MSDVNGRLAADQATAGDAANSSTSADSRDHASDDSEVAAIESDVERTRVELAQTVDQLAAKLDVSTRVRNRVNHARDGAASRLRMLRDRATDERGKPTPLVRAVGAGVVGAAMAVVVVLWRRDGASSRGRMRRR